MKVGLIVTLRGGSVGDVIRDRAIETACSPIDRAGWAMAVSRGWKRSAHSKSSNDTRAMSSGMARPASRSARTAPIVMRLLPTTRAVGGRPPR